MIDPTCVANLPGQSTLAKIKDAARRHVLSRMPIFEVQSMIDTLYLYSHPATDLPGVWSEITLEQARHLCLDVKGGDPSANTPVWLYWCTLNGAQRWSYDRKSGRIMNTAFNMCLEVQPPGDVDFDNPFPGAIAQIGSCEQVNPDLQHPLPTRQQWSYDPEGKIIRSAEGTVLDVEGGNLQATNPVWLWDYNGGGAQLWHADQGSAPVPATPRNPGILTASEGLLAGQTLSSPDGRFSLSLSQFAGDPILSQSGVGTIWQGGGVGLSNSLLMQGDGNFVLYNLMGAPLWASNTPGNPGAYVALQNDGNLVVYSSSNRPLWASNTCCR
jgi:hypothetical protein